MKSLNDIDSPIERYDAVDRGHINAGGRLITTHEATELLNDRSRWPEKLPLKVGAQVMLVTVSACGTMSADGGRTGCRVW